MMNFTGITLFLLCGSLVSVNSVCQILNKIYNIKTMIDDFVLDGSDTSQVKIQVPINNSTFQHWRIVCGMRPGVYILMNVGNGLVLDTERILSPLYLPKVVMGKRDESTWQEWFLHFNGNIVNAAWRQHLKLFNSTFIFAGDSVIVSTRTDQPYDEWILQEIEL